MNVKEIDISNYTYELPENRIAQYPLALRDSSKLLIYKNSTISEDIYHNVCTYVPKGSLLVFNNTKVIHARLVFQNSSGGKIEIFCLEPASDNSEPVSAMTQKKSVRWKCLVGRVTKWKEKILTLKSDNLILLAEITERSENSFTIEFKWTPEELSFAEVIEALGDMPIPPYLKRESEAIDSKRYQTVYALSNGSVAAPTAGLHFTSERLSELSQNDVKIDYLTLHVGAGTFMPVKTEKLEGHIMHSEWIDVRLETLNNILEHLRVRKENCPLIAIGTTSLRTIESMYWMGLKASINPNSTIPELEIKQWDPYQPQEQVAAITALEALKTWLIKNNQNRLICRTQLLIVPVYKLKVVNALITNFHQPNSTLLLLVAAVAGESWRKIYNYALENDFRFLSYGDGSLLFSDNHSV